MTERLLSDDERKAYRSLPKRVTNPGARWSGKPGHRQRRYEAVSEDEARAQFLIYLRQNLHDEIDFSCGLALIQNSGQLFSLARYNGANHLHGAIAHRCHIHRATAEALSAGKKLDSHAEETDRYRTLDGALACLIEDCAVQGLAAKPDHPELFDDVG